MSIPTVVSHSESIFFMCHENALFDCELRLLQMEVMVDMRHACFAL